MLSLNVSDAHRVARKFKELEHLTKSEIKVVGRSVLDYVQANMPDYPPEPIGSKYIRTLNLFDALRSTEGDHPMSLMSVKSINDGAVTTIGVSGYGPLVVGLERQQAWMHRGRWFTLTSVVRELMPGIVRVVLGKVNEWIGSAGFGM